MKIYLLFLATLSLVTFFVYVADKAKAKRGAWRIPEKVLLSLGFFGGAVGALIAMQTVRHKTKHWYFTLTNILSIVGYSCVIYFLNK